MNRILPGVVLATLLVAGGPARAGDNVDTGIGRKQCVEAGSAALVDCATATLPGQDGQLGRDAHDGKNGKSDGRLGASYTRVCNSGAHAGENGCPRKPVLGPGDNDWGCTLDNLSGALWEVKTATGLRAGTLTYTNYSSDYDPAGLYRSPTDAQGYVDAVNKQGLCGAHEWGLGHATKIQTIVDYGVDGAKGRVELDFFPNGVAGPHWDSSANPSRLDTAWAVDYTTGELDNDGNRALARPVMLVLGKRGSGDGATYELLKDGAQVSAIATGANVIWRRCVEGLTWDGTHCVGVPQTFTLDEALAHAQSESIQNGVGWHVPNVKELTWTVLHDQVYPSIDAVEFPDTPIGAYCTSTPDVVTAGQAWVVDFGVGQVRPATRTVPCLLRLAR